MACGVLVACAVLAYPRAAAAFSCGAPRQLTPLDGAVVPSDSLIWDICYKHSPEASAGVCTSSVPTLRDGDGRTIELVVERQVDVARHAKVVTAYRPREALAVGMRYRVQLDYSPRFSHEFSVIAPEAAPLSPPVVSAIDFAVDDGVYSAFNARFTFEPFSGNLVAETEGALSSELEGLDLSWWLPVQAEQPRYYLANEPPCYVNFPEATWGAAVNVRFGVMSLAGEFSGWSEPISLEYPLERTTYPEVEGGNGRPDTGVFCSVSGPAPSSPARRGSALLAASTIAGALLYRRASRGATAA